MDGAILELHEHSSIHCKRVGNEQQALLIVDNFLHGADFLKQYAVRQNQFSPADNYYPGIRMEIPLIYTIAAAKNVEKYINEFFGLKLKDVKKAASRYSIVTTPPSALDLLQKIPHFDAPSRKSLAMVHFLCEASDTGTALYRHCKTGYEYIDTKRYDSYMKCIKDRYSSSSEYPDGYINGSTDEFEVIESVAAAYNKVIMYHGSSLHSGIIPGGYNFDSNPASGRLSITTFIEFE